MRSNKPKICPACGAEGHQADRMIPGKCSRAWLAFQLAQRDGVPYKAAAAEFGITKQAVSEAARGAGVRRYKVRRDAR